MSFSNVWDRFGADGQPKDAEAAAKVMATMLARLSWWALALRKAREETAYLEAVA